MGALSVANLKTNNRNFDNILDSYLNLVDGGAITGAVTFTGGNTLGDAAGDHQVLNGKVSIGATSAYAVSSATATSSTIAVTHSTNTPVPAISQPAGTIIKDVIFINAGNLVTNGSSGNDLDFDIGTSAAGAQIVALTALLDDAGGAVTWTANSPLWVIRDSNGHAANAFAAGTTNLAGTTGGPATSEAIALASTLYSAAARDIHVNFRPHTGNMTTAATTVKVIMTFMYL